MVEKVDVEEIVKTIRQEKTEITNISCVYNKIKGESVNKTCDILPIEKALNRFADKRVTQILDYVKPRCEMRYYREITDKNPIKKFVKKAIRKTIKFCIYPMSVEQSVFNLNLVQIIEQQQQQIRELRAEIDKLNN